MIELEQEALQLNQEILTEVKNLMDDINDTKPTHLQQFIHPQWGSVLGSEKDIRLAVLKDEVEIWQERTGDATYPYGYVSDMLSGRIRELTS
tara:strand:+ start:404 stop:679 length:276 start_codon:yes stop_codon:yes gene_type:complete